MVAWKVFGLVCFERPLTLALLIAVLSFGFAFIVLSAHPDLFAGAALAGFTVTLASAKNDRSILFASATYGLTIAVLTLAHEAIPPSFSLGTVLAIVVLAANNPINIQRLSRLLAVSIGLTAAVVVALLKRCGISSQLCAIVPYDAVDLPISGPALQGSNS
ncbi:hypothetical protein [Mycobacterium uberis]|uniref:hypothetical protein n=1 Tax=Mycobacterium uberis TaxID=2162698 RepID=UPI0010591A14|nr:hypothetical protein [Mycobacterium uberis]